MKRPVLNPHEYLAELNRRLRLHKLYREGMEFLPSPDEDAVGLAVSGYSCRDSGPIELKGVYAQVAHQVKEEFDFLDD